MNSNNFVFRIFLLCLCFFLTSSLSYSQKVIYYVGEKGIDLKKSGPNKLFYHSFIVEYSNFLFKKNNNLKHFSSLQFAVGHLHKVKLGERLSLVGEMKYSVRNFNYRYPVFINFTETINSIFSAGISPSLLTRFNLEEKRGNHLGNYFEGGIAENILVYNRYKILPSDIRCISGIRDCSENSLKLIPSQTSVLFRFGFETVIVGYEYLLTNSLFLKHNGLFLRQPKHKFSILINI